MIYVFNEIDMISNNIYHRWLCEATEQRRTKALRYRFYKDRLLCIASYRLLCYALSDSCVEFEYLKHGKPYLKKGGKHFNITHCDGLVGCITSSLQSGIDAEMVAPYPREVTHRVFTEHEITQITASCRADMAFYKLWTLKESYVKALGFGLGFPLRNVEFTISGDDIRCSDTSFVFGSESIRKHIVSYCSKEKHQIVKVSLEELR